MHHFPSLNLGPHIGKKLSLIISRENVTKNFVSDVQFQDHNHNLFEKARCSLVLSTLIQNSIQEDQKSVLVFVLSLY